MTEASPWGNRSRLKTRQLLLVVALADEGSIHRAAAALNMTQPAASKLLRELEESIGAVLFERLPRGMRPTLYGDALIRLSLKDLLPQLDPDQFRQISRGAIVNMRHVTSASRDDAGKLTLHLRNRTDKLRVSPLFAHLFRQM